MGNWLVTLVKLFVGLYALYFWLAVLACLSIVAGVTYEWIWGVPASALWFVFRVLMDSLIVFSITGTICFFAIRRWVNR
jgi:hypothetical protein